MYLTVKQQVKNLTKEEYLILRELSHTAKNLYNVALYNIRQYFFETGEYLSYGKNNLLCKNNENYKILNSNMSQQILKEVDGTFKSFFEFLKLKKLGKYNSKVNIPKYLKKEEFFTLIIGFVRLNNNKLILPYSNTYKRNHKPIIITIPIILKDKAIKEIRIVPKLSGRYFEIQYTYKVEEEQRELNKQNALSIDLGINNLATCVTNKGKSFIVDGNKLKSINQWYNKQMTKYQSIKDKQKIKGITKYQVIITRKRNNQVNDYINKACRYITNYCINNDIGTIVLGYNEDIQNKINIGKVNNQNFVNIPIGNIKDKLDYLCKLYNITYIKQEESYTSKASFFDKDEIPTIGDKTSEGFSGKRIKRGLYKTSTGTTLNADVNAALNILKKSKVVDLRILYNRGEVDTPKRIRIA
ncbi:transposase [Tissierella sp. MB52-C2]|uniref:RNA-guided endonuclease InsQ/TnpB family protein n=1 Tax=Tissierella sp. MB52-C2 TaxID=3070999 RepID=UPI00280B8338|nr:transposase [Tissierella sp. MB52-C2]WMM25518.1 transposase [Tissierella sp. MB52-C2]